MERPFQAYDGDEPYVFVCYSHDDSEMVYQELTWLRDHGVNIWYDEGITPGEEFPERLGNAILGASLVLFYVSPRSVGSRHCRNEVFFALDRDTPVLAIHLERTELPPGLALSTGTAQAIMRYELRPADYCRKLLAGIAQHSEEGHKIEIEPELLAPPTLLQRMRPLVWPAAIALVIGALLVGGVQLKRYMDHQEDVRWARDEAMPQIRAMLENRWRDFTEPYALAVEAEKVIPEDPELQGILDAISMRVDVGSEPEGASVSYKNYATPEAEWIPLGTTPIEQVRLPTGIFRWTFELDGYEPVMAAASSWDIRLGADQPMEAARVFRTLDRSEDLPHGMVRVEETETPQGAIGDFFIDRFEVTNAQFQKFVDAGGYESPEYWAQAFVDGGEVLSREEAIARFVDSTGRRGPASWIGGHYPDRLGDHPVSGVSWYEADAYARWAGRELPTAPHWGLARGEYSPLIDWPQLGGFATFAPFSNVGGNATVAVGSLPGITAYGAFDLAGNVREWCSNDGPLGKAVRGGAWNDNPYDFAYINQAPPMAREVEYGFRTALYANREEIPEVVFHDVAIRNVATDLADFKPVSDEVFAVYSNQFAYDRGDLDVQPISVDDSHPDWTLERVSIAAPYGDDRIIVNLLLPRGAAPPYQTVIYVPGSAALFQQSSEDIAEYYEVPVFLSFLVKNGRAVVLPTYQGTFERWGERYPPMHIGARTHAFTEFIAEVVKDFRRTVDYLETREDIDLDALAFYGMSWGGWLGGIIAAVEDRLATMILLAGGVLDVGLPEMNPLNYVSRIDVPLLMLNGAYDTILNYEYNARPMAGLVATPPEDLRLRAYPTDHIPPKAEYVKEILDWLDKYFGPVTKGL